MNYKVSEIETFLIVMELGTLTAAAKRLNLSKSVISKRISDLENTLGANLFERHSGRTIPTSEAEQLAESVRPAMASLNAAFQSATRKKASPLNLDGALRVSAPISLTSIHLDTWSAAFTELHPNLQFAICYDERYRNILQDDIDVGIQLGEVSDTTLLRRTIWEDRMVACASASYLEKRNVPLHPLELSEHECIGYSHMANEQLWRFKEAGRTLTPVARTCLNANNAVTIRNFAQADRGVAMLPGFIAKPAIDAKRLVPLLTSWKTRSAPIVALWRRTQPERAEILAFVNFLEEMLASEAFWLRGHE